MHVFAETSSELCPLFPHVGFLHSYSAPNGSNPERAGHPETERRNRRGRATVLDDAVGMVPSLIAKACAKADCDERTLPPARATERRKREPATDYLKANTYTCGNVALFGSSL